MSKIPVPGGPADSPHLTVVGGMARLRPEEGTLTVGRIDGAVGAAQVAMVAS